MNEITTPSATSTEGALPPSTDSARIAKSVKIILRDSPEAAKRHTMNGWLSANGRFYVEEDVARYDGCTHQRCGTPDCGALVEKNYTYCNGCRAKRETEQYQAREKKVWNGSDILYSDLLDKYTTDPDDLLEIANDEMEEGDEPLTVDDLRLLICDPVYARSLDLDYFSDELPEKGEPPAALVEAIKAFNSVVDNLDPLSWSPMKFAAVIQPNTKLRDSADQ